MAENLYEIRNMMAQTMKTDKYVTGQIVEFNVVADEVINVYQSEIGPTMQNQLDNGIF